MNMDFQQQQQQQQLQCNNNDLFMQDIFNLKANQSIVKVSN